MQIRTALAIGTGLAIGIVVGVCINEDAKYKAISKVRNKLIKALGGEVKRHTPPKPTTYYAAFKDTNKKIDDLLDRITVFSTYEEATKCQEALINIINHNASASVIDLANYLDILGIDFTWDSYGWTRKDIDKMVIREMEHIDPLNHNVKHKLDLPKPKNLKY